MPCSECLMSQTASAITAAQPAAVFPAWRLQGLNCISVDQEGPEISRAGERPGLSLLLF